MKIGDRIIGQGQPVYVVAEVGSNHDGRLDQARELIRAAAEAGADAAKFQLYRADKLYPGTVTPFAIDDSWLPVLQEECWDHGIEFLCSVFCTETLAAYMQVDPPAVKIASPEATNFELLVQASLTGIPLLVSTGAMDWPMLDRSMKVLEDTEVALLHCVSAYPPLYRELNLRVIPAIAARYGVPVGFSDHTVTNEPPPLAVAAGACIVEKHFTYDRSASGADHPFALEPDMFKAMVEQIRMTEYMLGDGVKRVQPSEDATDRRAA